MANGDRRADTAEGRLELEREYRTVIQPEQFNRTFEQRERFEAGRDEDRDAAREQRGESSSKPSASERHVITNRRVRGFRPKPHELST